MEVNLKGKPWVSIMDEHGIYDEKSVLRRCGQRIDASKKVVSYESHGMRF